VLPILFGARPGGGSAESDRWFVGIGVPEAVAALRIFRRLTRMRVPIEDLPLMRLHQHSVPARSLATSSYFFSIVQSLLTGRLRRRVATVERHFRFGFFAPLTRLTLPARRTRGASTSICESAAATGHRPVLSAHLLRPVKQPSGTGPKLFCGHEDRRSLRSV